MMISGVYLLVLIFSISATQKKCSISGDFLDCTIRLNSLITDRSDGDDSFCSDCRSVLENENGNMCIPTVDPASFQQRLVTLNTVCGDAYIHGASLFSTVLALLVAVYHLL